MLNKHSLIKFYTFNLNLSLSGNFEMKSLININYMPVILIANAFPYIKCAHGLPLLFTELSCKSSWIKVKLWINSIKLAILEIN